MNSSFYNGISGMKTHQFGIDVMAANITGANTVGFKSSTPEFSSIYHTQLSGSIFDPISNDKGLGSTAQTTTTNFSHGTTVSTDGKYDLSINGDGWFGVVDATGQKAFTRAGAFTRDRDGFLVDDKGNHITGTSANNSNNGLIVDKPKSTIDMTKPESQTNIQLPDKLVIPAAPTTKVNFTGNLDSTIKTKFSAETEKNEEVPNVEVYRTTIFDKDGNENLLDIKFTKVVPQKQEGTTWNAVATLTDKDKNPISTNQGQIKFNGRGAMIENSMDSIDNNGTQTSLNLGSIYNPSNPNSGFDGLVSLNGFESERITTKDGHKQGNLVDYGLTGDGTIMASFDNGQNVPISKVAIYNFTNEGGLDQSNPVYFKETSNSGKAMFLSDKNGKYVQNSSIASNKLEMSNLNLTTALTELLVMQKAYEASAKSITTSDQLIQNAINMKK